MTRPEIKTLLVALKKKDNETFFDHLKLLEEQEFEIEVFEFFEACKTLDCKTFKEQLNLYEKLQMILVERINDVLYEKYITALDKEGCKDFVNDKQICEFIAFNFKKPQLHKMKQQKVYEVISKSTNHIIDFIAYLIINNLFISENERQKFSFEYKYKLEKRMKSLNLQESIDYCQKQIALLDKLQEEEKEPIPELNILIEQSAYYELELSMINLLSNINRKLKGYNLYHDSHDILQKVLSFPEQFQCMFLQYIKLYGSEQDRRWYNERIPFACEKWFVRSNKLMYSFYSESGEHVRGYMGTNCELNSPSRQALQYFQKEPNANKITSSGEQVRESFYKWCTNCYFNYKTECENIKTCIARNSREHLAIKQQIKRCMELREKHVDKCEFPDSDRSLLSNSEQSEKGHKVYIQRLTAQLKNCK